MTQALAELIPYMLKKQIENAFRRLRRDGSGAADICSPCLIVTSDNSTECYTYVAIRGNAADESSGA
jgi:hypothetical protein